MTITKFDIGDTVLCDDCNENYTDSNQTGGITFQSKAICPKCAPKWIKNAEEYNEGRFITAHCPLNMSFADWVRNVLRGGKPGKIEIIDSDDLDEYLNSI